MSTSLPSSRGDYEAARQGAALFEIPSAIHLTLAGKDRQKFLHNFCTNDVRGLTTGTGCEAFITNVQGKVLGHVFIHALPDALWLTGIAGNSEKLLAHLSRYQITEDVEFADRSATVSTQFVVGPLARDLVAGLLTGDSPQNDLEAVEFSFHGSTVGLFRNDLLGVPGYILVAAHEVASDLRNELIAGSARPAGSEAFEAMRIEAGFPLYGIDISDANLAQEVARTGRAISFTKGCYLGQEPIARIDALGHVNQELRGIQLVADPVPAAGSEVVTTDDPKRVIGRVTSAALSSADDRPVALALVRRGFESPGQPVAVRTGDVPVAGQVFWPEALLQ